MGTFPSVPNKEVAGALGYNLPLQQLCSLGPSRRAQLAQFQPTRAEVRLDFLQLLTPFVTFLSSDIYISSVVNTNTRTLQGFLQQH